MRYRFVAGLEDGAALGDPRGMRGMRGMRGRTGYGREDHAERDGIDQIGDAAMDLERRLMARRGAQQPSGDGIDRIGQAAVSLLARARANNRARGRR